MNASGASGTRSRGRWLAAMLLGLLLLALDVQPARAADQIELSSDGVHYGSSLSVPVFATAPVLVPGESAMARFWVRNPSQEDAVLTLFVRDARAAPLVLAAALSIAAGAGAGADGEPIGFEGARSCAVLVAGVGLGGGQAVPVDLTLSLADLDGTAGQGGVVTLELGVTVEKSVRKAQPTQCRARGVSVPVIGPAPHAAEEPAPSPSPAPSEGPPAYLLPSPSFTLAGSGNPAQPLIVVASGLAFLLALLYALWWLLALRRRDEEHEDAHEEDDAHEDDEHEHEGEEVSGGGAA